MNRTTSDLLISFEKGVGTCIVVPLGSYNFYPQLPPEINYILSRPVISRAGRETHYAPVVALCAMQFARTGDQQLEAELPKWVR